VPTIGETLREARMRQRLDIADVEARTKIRAKYLRALENEEFGLLPGATFVRTFLRTYAELLGLDPHRLVEEYRQNYESPDDVDLQPLTGAPAASTRRDRGPRPRPPAGPPNRLAIAGGAIVLILIFLIVLGLTGGNESNNGAQQSATTRTEKKPAKRKRKQAAAKPASVTLKVVPDGPTYVCLDRGPATPHLFEGTISEPQTFKGKKVRINLGRTAGQLIVNSKQFPVEPSATPVGYEFSTTGSKQIPPQQRPCVAPVGTTTAPTTTTTP
jgi:cytoskeleton protein RodZ